MRTFIPECSFQVIQLVTGENCYVDTEDFEKLDKLVWFSVGNGYAATSVKGVHVLMHHLVLNYEKRPETEVHHKDENTLNNRKGNLEVLNLADHKKTRKAQSNSKSGYKGVSYKKQGNRKESWTAQINFGGKQIHLGIFETPESAAKAYDEAAKRFYGSVAYLNFK